MHFKVALPNTVLRISLKSSQSIQQCKIDIKSERKLLFQRPIALSKVAQSLQIVLILRIKEKFACRICGVGRCSVPPLARFPSTDIFRSTPILTISMSAVPHNHCLC